MGEPSKIYVESSERKEEGGRRKVVEADEEISLGVKSGVTTIGLGNCANVS